MQLVMPPCIKFPSGYRLLLALICSAIWPGSLAASIRIENVDELNLDTPPEVVKRSQPRYPVEMLRAGIMGGAMIEFVVTSTGEVVEPRSVAETDPAFGEAAVKAVAKWKFKPGIRNGKSVFIPFVVPIYFTLNNSGKEDWAAKIQAVLTGFRRKPSHEVPEGLQYDTAPEPKIMQSPVWPWIDGVPVRAGKADVLFAINAKGRVDQVRIVSATSDAFGMAARAAVECWQFTPAKLDGKPVPALGRREVQFKLYLPQNAAELRLLKDIEAGTTQYANAAELDAALKPLIRIQPQYPTSLIEGAPEGTAVIECIVDRQGRVQLPRIIEASQAEFGWAAATASANWRFTPPTVKGQPVDVKMLIPFEFNRTVTDAE